MGGRSVDDWRTLNEAVSAEFRANAGRAPSRRWPVLLTTTGARSGRPRVTPLKYSVAGARLVVIASKGGAPAHPERTRLFDRQAAQLPFFDAYRRRVAARAIPVVVFERLGPARPPGGQP